jgi:putative phosphoribosyl transferase
MRSEAAAGLVTGASASAACRTARNRGAQRVVLAVPAVPADAVSGLYGWAEEVVRVITPPPPAAIGTFYTDFPTVTDQQVTDALRRGPAHAAG